MPRNSTIWILNWNKKFLIQVENEGVSIAQKLIFLFFFFYASPLSSSKSTNTRAVLDLDEADSRALAITFFMKILSAPAVFSRVENHFDRHEFLAQIIYDVLYPGLFFSN